MRWYGGDGEGDGDWGEERDGDWQAGKTEGNRKWTWRDGKGKGKEDGKLGMKRQEARKHKHRASPTRWEYTTKVDSSRIAQQHLHCKTGTFVAINKAASSKNTAGKGIS